MTSLLERVTAAYRDRRERSEAVYREAVRSVAYADDPPTVEKMLVILDDAKVDAEKFRSDVAAVRTSIDREIRQIEVRIDVLKRQRERCEQNVVIAEHIASPGALGRADAETKREAALAVERAKSRVAFFGNEIDSEKAAIAALLAEAARLAPTP